MANYSRSMALGALLALGPVASASIPTVYPTGPGPATVTVGRDGKLVYTYDTNGDRIPDFSACGYGGGGVTIPAIPVKTTLTPVSGDNVPQIQAAIDALAAQPLGVDGFRGAILLKAGVYPISATINLTAQGIVLRGEGSSASGTILRLKADGQTLNVSGTGSRSKISGTTHNVADAYVPVGATWLTLDSVANLNVGDTIVIHRPTDLAWASFVGQADHFQSGDADLDWDRTITEIDGNRIRFDAPITEALDAAWSGGTVYKYTWPTRLTNCGVEDLRADCPAGVDTLGNTSGSFMTLSSTKNCWVRRCYNDKMRGHAILVSGSKWDTAEDITSFHNPLPGAHSGASTQIFAGSGSQLILFHRISAYSGGFEFSGGSKNAGPIAWVESQVPKGFAFSGPHLQWNMGYLWDSLNMAHNLTCIEQHAGETGGNHVAWNCESTANYNFETVPTVHQWIQGCCSSQAIPKPSANGPPEVLSYNTHLQPGSLYRAQLYERVGEQPGLATLGQPDGSNWFDVTGATAVMIPQGQVGTAPITLTPAVAYSGQAISFACSGLPTGATSSFSAPTLTGAGSTTLTIKTRPTTPQGKYSVTVMGTGTFNKYFGGTESLKRSTVVTVVVGPAVTTPPPPPAPLVYEAENLTISATSAGDTTTVLAESGLSAGHAVQLNSNAVGDFIRFVVPTVPAGSYDVHVGVKKYRPRAIVQTKAGPAGGLLAPGGSPIDEYSASTVYADVDLGFWSNTAAGNKELEFDVIGKNASSSGYTVVIDYITLVPQ